jgi:hypothetical protein
VGGVVISTIDTLLSFPYLVLLLAMEQHLNEFLELLKEIMSQEPKPILSEEEIHFDILSMRLLQMAVEYMYCWPMR